jgi:hypothetical protein
MDCPVLLVIVLCLVTSVANVYGLTSLVCDRSVFCVRCCLCLWIVQSCLWPLCILYPVLPMFMDWPVLFVTALTRHRTITNKTGQFIDIGNTGYKIQNGHKPDWTINSHWQYWDCPVLFVTTLYLVPSFANVYGLTSFVCDRSVSCVQCCLCLWIVQSCLTLGTRHRTITNKTGQFIDTGNTGYKIQNDHKPDWTIHGHRQHWIQDTERSEKKTKHTKQKSKNMSNTDPTCARED